MVDQILVWTALPAGMYAPDVLRLSVFVTPQLYPAGGAGQLADFDLGNWASKIPGLSFYVYTNGTFYPAQLQDPWRLRPDVWNELFPPHTLVRPYEHRRFQDTAIVSFDQQPLLDYIRTLYASTAGVTMPRVVDPPMADLVDKLGDLDSLWSPLVQQRKQDLAAGFPPDVIGFEQAPDLPGLLDPARKQAAAFTRFHDRYGRHTYGPVVPPPELPMATRYDFHQVVSMLGDQPHILRALGLVFDVAVPVPTLPSTGTIVVASEFPANWQRSHWVLPFTHYELRPQELFFQPAPRDPNEIEGGMLRLENPAYSVHQIDLDGTMAQLEDTAMQLRNVMRRDTAFGAPDAQVGNLVLETRGADREPEGLPATRNGGISVARDGRSATVRAMMNAQNALPPIVPVANSYTDPEVWAEDVMRGYRVDVLAGGDWRSLHMRTGATNVAGISLPLEPGDEGYVKATTGAGRSFGLIHELRVHPSLFGWDGWSLSCTRPGKAVLDPKLDPGVAAGEKPNVAPSDLPYEVSTDFHATFGTLPRLRYGQTYRLRARVVDLAGNSISLGNAGDAHASAAITYRRVDPVLPPVLVPRWRYADGASLEHMAIRSDVGMSPAQYSARVIEGQTFEDRFEYRPHDDRHVAPPKVAQHEAETHGMFDAALATQGPYAVYLLSLKEQGTFMDRKIFDGTSEQPTVKVPGIVVMRPGRIAGGALPARRGDGLAEEGSYVINTSASIPLPYLPDPFATGMAIHGMPDGVTRLLPFPQGTEWHDVRPFRLRLKAGDQASVSGTDPVTVTVPKGEMLELSFSSYFADPSQLDQMYMWHHHDPQLESMGMAGRLWQLTPSRTLKMVHAVQHPLAAPKVRSIATAPRFAGNTFVDVASLECDFHVPSTGTLSLFGEWEEWNDSGGGTPGDATTAPALVARQGHAFDLLIPYNDVGVYPKAGDPSPRFELGDTRRRLVRWRAVGTTRYREYFDRVLWDDLTRSGPLRAGATDIPSTAAPPAPKVAYVVPAFTWTEQPNVSIRRGGGLRIWLDRPWYVSGEGELLAVIVSATQNASANVNRDHVSEWGADPATNGVRTTPNLLEQHVVSPVLHKKVFTLADGTKVRALGHAVSFSVEKNQWYCDVDLDTGSAYSPFVRLALARFQPGSVDGCHLSPIVKVDFVQVAATREAQVSVLDPTHVEVRLTGPSGATHWGLASEPQAIGEASGHHVRARLEQRLASEDDVLGWQPVTDAPIAAAGVSSGVVTWLGTLTVPAAAAGVSRRIVIEEREVHAADSHRGTPAAERLVYVAEIAI